MTGLGNSGADNDPSTDDGLQQLNKQNQEHGIPTIPIPDLMLHYPMELVEPDSNKTPMRGVPILTRKSKQGDKIIKHLSRSQETKSNIISLHNEFSSLPLHMNVCGGSMSKFDKANSIRRTMRETKALVDRESEIEAERLKEKSNGSESPMTLETLGKTSEESDPDYDSEEGESAHSRSESSSDKEVTTNSSEQLKREMRVKKRHDAGYAEQWVQNDRRE
ncbi:hypothetical protein Cgig2_002926 [Carnegiea gigantea]|uniref:Uncharacterized protein n=1 Tax=Carnegiea gigantea TaxID=171969 RepID=A0A9Q1JNB5_9CARY|nr:hypothetical protein Cgig2_002926 [Carnegiea gigantea]